MPAQKPDDARGLKGLGPQIRWMAFLYHEIITNLKATTWPKVALIEWHRLVKVYLVKKLSAQRHRKYLRRQQEKIVSLTPHTQLRELPRIQEVTYRFHVNAYVSAVLHSGSFLKKKNTIRTKFR
jgi:hypothetical protein